MKLSMIFLFFFFPIVFAAGEPAIEIRAKFVSVNCSAELFIDAMASFDEIKKALENPESLDPEMKEAFEIAQDILLPILREGAIVHAAKAIAVIYDAADIEIPSVTIEGEEFPLVEVSYLNNQYNFNFKKLFICRFVNSETSEIGEQELANAIRSMLK